MKLRDHIKLVNGEIVNRLVNAGFKKRKGLLQTPIGVSLSGTLGLNRATHGSRTEVSINPVIGVSHALINELYDELIPGRDTKYVMITVSTPVGYLTPENAYKMWDFHIEDEIGPIADDLVWCVVTYGLHWMKEQLSSCALLKTIRKHGMPGTKEFMLPLALKYFGEVDEMEEALEEFHPKNDRPSPALDKTDKAFENSEHFETVMKTTWRPPRQERLDEYDRFAEKLRALKIPTQS